MAALSRTERLTTCSTAAPCHFSPCSGPVGTRPRLGFRPNNPQHAAGMRIDPPPSPAPATGTMPAATAAAAPPLLPPGVCPRFQGLRAGPNSTGSVTPIRANSGVLVLPKILRPATCQRRTNSASSVGTKLRNARLPDVCGAPVYCAPKSFSKNGTPPNGPAGNPAPARCWACSYSAQTTALIWGFTA